AQVLRWDRASTEAPVVHTLPAGFYDNLSFADDGTLYVSNFSTPELTAIADDGTQTIIALGS
ncbi:MAG: hypothetical protein ACI9C1_001161, partial [Candidatus Aldehydirespiratoraceae bacterium]